MTPALILASGSPRRRALLAALGVEFEVRTSTAEEPNCGATPTAMVEENARIKCMDVAAGVDGDTVVIGADTLVFYGDAVLTKPKDKADAFRMLRMLSGNTHAVVTGLAVLHTGTGKTILGSESTAVTFRELCDAEIQRFIEVVNPLDRAGAYTIDGPGTLLVSGYAGCYQNVLGFPMVRLDEMLRQHGVQLFNELHAERAQFL
mgnify:CR=1 FL=1